MAKKLKKIEREFERRDKKSDEQIIREHEERQFHRMAQSMGYRLPGSDPRRRHEIQEK